MTGIEAWHELYIAAAAAEAVLLGLLFVAGTIRRGMKATGSGVGRHGWQHLFMNLHPLESDELRLANETYVMFVYALAVSLAMLAPVDAPFVPALIVLVVAALGLVETTIPIWQLTRRPSQRSTPSGFELLWRYVLPFVSMLLIGFGGLALAVAWEETRGLEAIAAGVLLLMFGATRNAWDDLLTIGSASDGA